MMLSKIYKTNNGRYVCPRDKVVLRGTGGHTDMEKGLYHSTALCDLCGYRIKYTIRVGEGFAQTVEETITDYGEVRAHIKNVGTGQLLACSRDRGYLYDVTKSNGTRGRKCTRCGKYRDDPKQQMWRDPPPEVEVAG